jgi:hypothetical protein
MACDLTGVPIQVCANGLDGLSPLALVEVLASISLSAGGVTIQQAQTEICAKKITGLNDLELLKATVQAFNVDDLTPAQIDDEACDLRLGGYDDEWLLMLTVQALCNANSCTMATVISGLCGFVGYNDRRLREFILVGASSGSVTLNGACEFSGMSDLALREALLIVACSGSTPVETFYRISQIGDVRISAVGDSRIYQ